MISSECHAALRDELTSLVHETGLFEIAQDSGFMTGDWIPTFEAPSPNSSLKRDFSESFGTDLSNDSFSGTSTSVEASFLDSDELDSSQDSSFSQRKKKRPLRNNGKKTNKGLRHFSYKVCQKLREKKVTTYGVVADELVEEFKTINSEGVIADEKNIRRRVYDAINVLLAINMITKDRKEIKWRGETNHDTDRVAAIKDAAIKRINKKKEFLRELSLEHTCLSNLLNTNGQYDPAKIPEELKIQIPFILVHTSHETKIKITVSPEQTEFDFNFDQPFEILDYAEILYRMGLYSPVEMKQEILKQETS